jgi:hypothetical protein
MARVSLEGLVGKYSSSKLSYIIFGRIQLTWYWGMVSPSSILALGHWLPLHTCHEKLFKGQLVMWQLALSEKAPMTRHREIGKQNKSYSFIA